MTIDSMGNTPAYRVTGISPDQYSSDAAGNARRGRIVHFALADGTTDQVFVPDAQWGTSAGEATIEQGVIATARVRSMGHD